MIRRHAIDREWRAYIDANARANREYAVLPNAATSHNRPCRGCHGRALACGLCRACQRKGAL